MPPTRGGSAVGVGVTLAKGTPITYGQKGGCFASVHHLRVAHVLRLVCVLLLCFSDDTSSYSFPSSRPVVAAGRGNCKSRSVAVKRHYQDFIDYIALVVTSGGRSGADSKGPCT